MSASQPQLQAKMPRIITRFTPPVTVAPGEYLVCVHEHYTKTARNERWHDEDARKEHERYGGFISLVRARALMVKPPDSSRWSRYSILRPDPHRLYQPQLSRSHHPIRTLQAYARRAEDISHRTTPIPHLLRPPRASESQRHLRARRTSVSPRPRGSSRFRLPSASGPRRRIRPRRTLLRPLQLRAR